MSAGEKRRIQPIIAIVLVLLAVIMAGFSGWISSSRELSPLEAALTQGMTLLFGLAGSFWAGSLSASRMAKQLVRPYARSAFRRVRAIYFGLSDIANELTNHPAPELVTNEWALSIGRMQSIAATHLATADDAMDEWKDLVPDDVNELKEELAARLGRTKRELHGDRNA